MTDALIGLFFILIYMLFLIYYGLKCQWRSFLEDSDWWFR